MLEGRQICHYLLLQQIGSGGMGTVYLARDSRVAKVREVAVKIIALSTALKPEELEHKKRLFRREIEAIAHLDHPHILPLFDFGAETLDKMEYIYLIMPYRAQGSLRGWLDEHDPVHLTTISSIIIQAAKALHYVHKRGIVHRDVKPSNFMIRERASTADLSEPYPFVQLTDFGLASFSAASSDQGVAGTPQFMAPEQWQGQPVATSDQYALAVMAFKLLTGQYVFTGQAAHIMYQHHFTPPPSLRSLRPDLPPEVDEVIARALSKEPEKRFSTVTNFAAALHKALGLPNDPNNTLLPDTPSSGSLSVPAPAPTIGPTSLLPCPEQDSSVDGLVPSSSSSSAPELITFMATAAASDFASAVPAASQTGSRAPSPSTDAVKSAPASTSRSLVIVPAAPLAERRRDKRLRRLLPAAFLVFALLFGGGALITHLGPRQSKSNTRSPGTPSLTATSSQSTATTTGLMPTPMLPSPTPGSTLASRPPAATPTAAAPSTPPPFTFEDGGMDGWSASNGLHLTECTVNNSAAVGGYLSTHALQIVIKVNSSSAGPTASVRVGNGPTAGSTISAWFYVPAAVPGGIEAKFFVRDSTEAWRDPMQGFVSINNIGNWFQVRETLNNSYTGPATLVGITFHVEQINTDITVYVDDVNW